MRKRCRGRYACEMDLWLKWLEHHVVGGCSGRTAIGSQDAYITYVVKMETGGLLGSVHIKGLFGGLFLRVSATYNNEYEGSKQSNAML